MKRALTMLNQTGHITITWEAENDERMIEIIERKMAQGCTFFLIEPRMGGLIAPDISKPLKKTKDALKHRALSMLDEDFDKLVAEGKADLVQTPDKKVKTIRKAKTAREVVSGGESVGTQPRQGG